MSRSTTPFWSPWAFLGVVAMGAGAGWVAVTVARRLSTWWRLRKYKEEI